MHMATIDNTNNHSLLAKSTLIAATCAADSSTKSKGSVLGRLGANVKVKLPRLKAWFTTNRGFYSESERQRYLADSAVQRAQYRMRSFY